MGSCVRELEQTSNLRPGGTSSVSFRNFWNCGLLLKMPPALSAVILLPSKSLWRLSTPPVYRSQSILPPPDGTQHRSMPQLPFHRVQAGPGAETRLILRRHEVRIKATPWGCLLCKLLALVQIGGDFSARAGWRYASRSSLNISGQSKGSARPVGTSPESLKLAA